MPIFFVKRVLPKLEKDFKVLAFFRGALSIFKTSSKKNEKKPKQINLKRADAYHGLMHTLMNN